jgi:O-antigen ligase
MLHKFFQVCIHAMAVAVWFVPTRSAPSDILYAWLTTICVLAALQISASFHYSEKRVQIVVTPLSLSQFMILAVSALSMVWMVIQELAPHITLNRWANLNQRNLFASLMSLGALVWWLRVSATQSVRVISTLAVATLAAAAAWSASRTAAVQWLAFIVLAFCWRKTLPIAALRTLAWGVCAYVAVVLTCYFLPEAGTGLAVRLTDLHELSRLDLWRNTVDLISQSPLLGHGWRSLAYMHYSTEFSGPRFMEMLDNAHNLPLHLAVESGIPVALAFCGGVGWLIWRNKPWAERRSDRQLAWGMLMVIGIHSLVEYPLWYGPFFMTMVIAVGILCADGWRAWLLAQTQDTQRTVLWGMRSFAVLLLAGTAFVAFDYHRVSQIYLQPEERSNWYKADPLAAAKKSVLFQSHAKFAELQITPLSRETAPRILELSSELVMWSPEPRIIEKLIESAVMMGLDDVAAFHLKRYKVAYPQAYALWSQRKL